MDEHYHSVNGAVQESTHVFINSGLEHWTEHNSSKTSLKILEMGFGTGLNALLTAIEAEKKKLNIKYTTLEKYPLSEELTSLLNYSDLNKEIFKKIHTAPWEEETVISPYFSIKKIETDFNDYLFPDNYDIIYYDAFAPDKQLGVWSQELFDKIYKQTNINGVMTTYCAKGVVRRMMQESGFVVERIPGPPGKREMLRASRSL